MAMSVIFGIVDSVLVLPPSFPSLSTATAGDRGAARGDVSRDAGRMRDMPESHAGCCAMVCEAGSIHDLAGAWQMLLWILPAALSVPAASSISKSVRTVRQELTGSFSVCCLLLPATCCLHFLADRCGHLWPVLGRRPLSSLVCSEMDAAISH